MEGGREGAPCPGSRPRQAPAVRPDDAATETPPTYPLAKQRKPNEGFPPQGHHRPSACLWGVVTGVAQQGGVVQALLLQTRERADQQQSRLYDISSFSPSNAIVPIAAEQGSFPTDIGQQVAMTTGTSSPLGPGFWKVSSMNPNPRLQASVQPRNHGNELAFVGVCRAGPRDPQPHPFPQNHSDSLGGRSLWTSSHHSDANWSHFSPTSKDLRSDQRNRCN